MSEQPIIHLLSLKSYDVYKQLLLEEALLRTTSKNWCLLNWGSPIYIIMGISGKPKELIDLNKIHKSPLSMIRRYSGGGTVVVDDNTLFVSFIFQKEAHSFPCYPEPILRWSEALYQKIFLIPTFHLRENDYVIGEKKCGGNAQYIQRDRFVHHTTFLWDYSPDTMNYLLQPKKMPNYRLGRSHQNFLCRMKDYLPSQQSFFDKIEKFLDENYQVKHVSLNEVLPALKDPHRKSTTKIESSGSYL